MIRLLSFTLDNVKNVKHGRLDFPVLTSGGSVTGIYGANGSGKTTVLDALALLKRTMSGKPICASCGALVTIGEDTMSLSAVFLTAPHRYLEYSVEYRKDDAGLNIGKESICLLDDPEQSGRPIVVNDNADNTGLGLTPDYLWRSVAKSHGGRDAIVLARRATMLERRSYLFSAGFLTLTSGVKTGEGLSAKASDRVGEVAALADAVRRLRAYAEKDMAIPATKNTASADHGLLPLGMPHEDGGPSARFLDLRGENIVTETDMGLLDCNVRMLNQVLPVMVPGLTIRLKRIGTAVMGDGGVGVRFEPVCVREGAEVPLRNESEGIVRIVGTLAYLIRAFNDPDACVAIDGLDAGVFEYLFGAMLEEFVRVGQGQLIFTAHNLRPMERMQPTPDMIVLSTLDPHNRFIPYRDLDGADDPRRRYFKALELGGTTTPLYKEGVTPLIGVGFTLASTDRDLIGRQVEDGLHTLLDVPTDGLEKVL